MPNTEQAKVLNILDLLNNDPVQARAELSKDPEFAEYVIKLLQPLIEERSNYFWWLSELFKSYLFPVAEDSLILFLGSGDGVELLYMRGLAPRARIVAIDNVVSSDSVVTELASKAKFFPLDLAQHSKDDITGKIGGTPDIVVCRHPNAVEFPEFPHILADWEKLMEDTSGKMLITTFREDEKNEILGEMAKQQVSLIPSRFQLGAEFEVKGTGVIAKFDDFVINIG